MQSILDLWDYELARNNAGAFGMQYIVSHPSTRARAESQHLLKSTSLMQQIMGYIAGGDGLSQAEIDLLCENQQLLCSYTFTSKLAKTNLEKGAAFTDAELTEAIAKYLEMTGSEDSTKSRQHLVSSLYMTLCVAGSDGLGDAETDKFYIAADKMGFERAASDQILTTYRLECQLIASFNEIYAEK